MTSDSRLFIALAGALAIGLTPATTMADEFGYLTSKTPYQPQQDHNSYEPAPDGFEIHMIQHVARHGSRGLSSPDDDDLMMQLWQQAAAEEELTALGLTLGPGLEDMLAVHESLGYGQLSRLGEIEHEQTAARILERHPQWLPHRKPPQFIKVTHSGRSRAVDSGRAFTAHLIQQLPHLHQVIQAPYASPETLYFHKAEGSEGFDDYRRNNPRLMQAIDRIQTDPRTEEVVNGVLRRLFSESFIERLAAGEYEFRAADDPSDKITTPFDAVMSLYGLYSIAPNLEEELTADFTPFIIDEHAAWLAYLDDADSFYGRGPGFADLDITYRAADALFAEMLHEIQASATDSSHLASFRFTHAQVTMPIATWLRLPLTDSAVTDDVLYDYESNPWRGGLVSPMGANLQWEVYRNTEGQLLVRMLHLEREASFPAPCVTYEDSRFFYQFEELMACLPKIHPSLTGL